ncbi:MAG: CapA family protein [Eubacteriales bacterium]|nr:CapA family protein [Eubacteriales bacterium]
MNRPAFKLPDLFKIKASALLKSRSMLTMGIAAVITVAAAIIAAAVLAGAGAGTGADAGAVFGDVPGNRTGSSPGTEAGIAVADPETSDEGTNKPNPSLITAKIAVAGDIVLHMPIINSVYDTQSGEYDFKYIFKYAEKYFNKADLSVACLETTFPGSGYSGYPMFRAPDIFAWDLKEAGIDLLSTACNHSVDSGLQGLVRTLDILEENGISNVGTYRSAEERQASAGIRVIDVKGIRIAFLAFTYGTNGMPVTGFEYAVNIYTKDYMTDISIIDYDLLKNDMAAARGTGADMIAVFMHWGNEYHTLPSPQQKELAEFLFSEGAGLILGGHVHVPQPMGIGDSGYICYCLGNFISNQQDKYTNLTSIVNIELVKNVKTGETKIAEVSYVPMYMLHPNAANDGKYCLLDIHEAILRYESGSREQINESVYHKLQEALEDIRTLYGSGEQLQIFGRTDNRIEINDRRLNEEP